MINPNAQFGGKNPIFYPVFRGKKIAILFWVKYNDKVLILNNVDGRLQQNFNWQS